MVVRSSLFADERCSRLPVQQRVQINRSAKALKGIGVPLESTRRKSCVVLAKLRGARSVERGAIRERAWKGASTMSIGMVDAFGVRLLISRAMSDGAIQSERVVRRA
jgi:hypothetical protein